MLASSSVDDVVRELARLDTARDSLSPVMLGALRAARGLLASRRGDNDTASREIRLASHDLRAAGDDQAAILAECEALAAEQRVSRANARGVIDATLAIERASSADDLIVATAATVRGAAHIAVGEPEAAIAAIAEAIRRAEAHLPERARALNALGTLYTALGETGAATTVLEHACELSRRLKIATTEAIAHGQLGALALARGELETARGHLGAQELLAARLGDRHGRARALTYLAEIALEANQAEAARDLALQARAVARASVPPLSIFDAFAERIELRANVALGGPPVQNKLEALRQRFADLGVWLGAALVDLDATGDATSPKFHDALSTLAALGLTQRMAAALQASRDAAVGAAREDLDATIAALAQLHPHIADAHASDLVFSAPATLATIGARRLSAQRNLAKLGALHVRACGLTIAVAITDASLVPAPGVTATFAGALGEMRVWVWSVDAKSDTVDAEVRALIGERGRAVVSVRAAARVARVPFAGDMSAHLEGVDLLALMRAAEQLEPGTFTRLAPTDGASEPMIKKESST